MGPWNPIFFPEVLGTNGVLFLLCSEVSETDIRPDHVLLFEVNQKMDKQKKEQKHILAPNVSFPLSRQFTNNRTGQLGRSMVLIPPYHLY